MATRLDYDPINVPNLGGINPYARFNSGFQSAIDNALGAVDVIENDLTRQAQARILERASQFSDPAAYQEALESGQILGDEARYVSSDFINSIYNRGNQLLDRQITLNRFNQTLESQAEADRIKQLKTNAAADVSRALTLASNGRPQAALNFARNSETIAALPQNIQADYFNRIDTVFSRGSNITDRQRSESRLKGQNWARQVLTASGGNVPQIRAAFRSGNLTPIQESAARDYFQGQGIDLIKPIAAVAPNNEAASNALARMTPTPSNFSPKSEFWDVAYGGGAFGSANLTDMTIGNAMQWAQGLRDRTEGTLEGQPENVGTSAIGAFQINKATLQQFAPMALGSDWKSKPYSAENQWKIAKTIFNYNKERGIPLDQRWAGLTPEQGEQLLNMSWSEAAPIIASVENPYQFPVQQRPSTEQSSDTLSQPYTPEQFINVASEVAPLIERTLSRQSPTLPEAFDTLRVSNAPAIEVANLITGEARYLPEETKADVLKVVSELSNQYNLPAATVGYSLVNHLESQPRGSFGIAGAVVRGAGNTLASLVNTDDLDSLGNFSIDIDALKEDLKSKSTSASLFTASDRRTTQADLNELNKARTNYQSAREKYLSIQNAKSTGAPYSQQNERTVYANMVAASSKVNNLLEKYTSDTGMEEAGITETDPGIIVANDITDVPNLNEARDNNSFNLRDISDRLQSARFDLRMAQADPNTPAQNIRNIQNKIMSLRTQLREAQAKVLQ